MYFAMILADVPRLVPVPPHTNRDWIIILIAVLIIGLVGFFFFRKRGNSASE